MATTTLIMIIILVSITVFRALAELEADCPMLAILSFASLFLLVGILRTF